VIFVALVGATLILVRGSILAPVRKLWPALLGCAQCTGFWVGAAAGAMGFGWADPSRVLSALFAGCATSVLALGTDAALVRLLGDPHEEAPRAPNPSPPTADSAPSPRSAA